MAKSVARTRIIPGIVAAVALGAACISVAAVAAAVAPAAAPAAVAAPKLASGLTPLERLVELMDTDQSGKVSKTEFMQFMEAEFDFADKNHDGELDPAELKNLVYRMNHPSTALPRVRK